MELFCIYYQNFSKIASAEKEKVYEAGKYRSWVRYLIGGLQNYTSFYTTISRDKWYKLQNLAGESGNILNQPEGFRIIT